MSVGKLLTVPLFAQQNTQQFQTPAREDSQQLHASFMILAASCQDMSCSMITNTVLYFSISSLSRSELWTTPLEVLLNSPLFVFSPALLLTLLILTLILRGLAQFFFFYWTSEVKGFLVFFLVFS